MRYQFALDYDGFKAFNSIIRKGNGGNRKFYLTVVFLLIVWALIESSIESISGTLSDLNSFVLISAWFIFLLGFLIFWRKRNNRKCSAAFKKSTMADPIKVSFDEKALTSEGAHQKTIMRWSAFQKITVENQYICVWYREA